MWNKFLEVEFLFRVLFWGFNRKLLHFQSDPAQEYGSPHYDPDAPYGQSPMQSPYRILPPIGSAEARVRYQRRHWCEPL